MSLTLAFLLLTTLASALIAGLFYAYQWTVMPGLNAIEPLAAIKAMNSINVVILNPVFFFSFFGTLLFGAVTAILYLWTARDAATLCVWAGFLAYAIGTFGVTIVFNVPLNNRLAASSPTAATAAAIWREYYDPWMYWNLIRTLAAIAAFVLFVVAVWMESR
jgi:uncharacterized membrane protein